MARKFISTSIAIDDDLREKVTQIAKHEGKSFSNWVRQQLIRVISETA